MGVTTQNLSPRKRLKYKSRIKVSNSPHELKRINKIQQSTKFLESRKGDLVSFVIEKDERVEQGLRFHSEKKNDKKRTQNLNLKYLKVEMI